MGVQDRDWYWKDRAQREQLQREPPDKEPTPRRQDPDAMIRRINAGSAPKLWGENWHWTIQLLVWLCIAALIAIIWRMAR